MFAKEAKEAAYQKELSTTIHKLVHHLEEEELRNKLLIKLGHLDERNDLIDREAHRYEIAVTEAVEAYNKLPHNVKIFIECDEHYNKNTNVNEIRLRLLYEKYDLYNKLFFKDDKEFSMSKVRELAYQHCHHTIMFNGILGLVTKQKKLIADQALVKKQEQTIRDGQEARAKIDHDIQVTRKRNAARNQEFLAQQRLAILTGAQKVKTQVVEENVHTIFLLTSEAENRYRMIAHNRSRSLYSNRVCSDDQVQIFRDNIARWKRNDCRSPQPPKPTWMGPETYADQIGTAKRDVLYRQQRQNALNSQRVTDRDRYGNRIITSNYTDITDYEDPFGLLDRF